MDSAFLKDFEVILDEILRDYRGQVREGADTSAESLIFIKSACLSSALWGLYRHQEWVSDQIFADTAEPHIMEQHAATYGVYRRAGESNDALLERHLANLRRPPAGGNRYDYEKWALEVAGVAQAIALPLAQGDGSVDVVIVADNETGMPDEALLLAVKTYIDELRPAGMRYLRVLGPTELVTEIDLTYSGTAAVEAVDAGVRTYVGQIGVGGTLVLMQLAAYLMQLEGVADLRIVAPVVNVVPDEYEKIKVGVLNVSQL